MKTTIEMSDDLFRKAKATAALRGQTLKELVTTAVRNEIEKASKKAKACHQKSDEQFWKEWDALAKEISKAWKNDLNAVEAVREQRRG